MESGPAANTNDWLRDETTDGSCQPDERRQLLRDAQSQQKRRSISAIRYLSALRPPRCNGHIIPKLDRPGNLGTQHGDTERHEVPCGQPSLCCRRCLDLLR